MTNERQWLRACGVILGDRTGNGIELSGLRVIFRVLDSSVETPNVAEIKIFNVAPEVSQQIGKEFSVLALQAGYEGNVAVIFTGDVRLVRRGKEQGTDTFVEILASDGDAAYNFAIVSTTLASGSTVGDDVAAAAATMGPLGVSIGRIKGLKAVKRPRGKVLHGPARKIIRGAAKSSGCSWSIQDGAIQILPLQEYLPGGAVELTGTTGLIGTPEQTIDGIKVRCLLNPRLKVGGRIHLDNASILLGKVDPTTQPQQATQQALKDLKKMVALDRDGFYRILAVAHMGDTRGNDWFSETLCVGIDASAPVKEAVNDQGFEGEEF